MKWTLVCNRFSGWCFTHCTHLPFPPRKELVLLRLLRLHLLSQSRRQLWNLRWLRGLGPCERHASAGQLTTCVLQSGPGLWSFGAVPRKDLGMVTYGWFKYHILITKIATCCIHAVYRCIRMVLRRHGSTVGYQRPPQNGLRDHPKNWHESRASLMPKSYVLRR